MKLRKRQRQFSLNALDVAAREDGRANEREIYGDLLPYVIFLRSKDWTVFKEGNLFRLGTRMVTAQGIYDAYHREQERHDRRESDREAGSEMVDAKRPARKRPASRATRSRSVSEDNSRGHRQGNRQAPARDRSRRSK